MCGATLKALHGLIHRFKNPEETIKPREFQVEQDVWCYRCKANIAIPLDGALKAAKQKVYGEPVHLS
jgi:hypothetical protein